MYDKKKWSTIVQIVKFCKGNEKRSTECALEKNLVVNGKLVKNNMNVLRRHFCHPQKVVIGVSFEPEMMTIESRENIFLMKNNNTHIR